MTTALRPDRVRQDRVRPEIVRPGQIGAVSVSLSAIRVQIDPRIASRRADVARSAAVSRRRGKRLVLMLLCLFSGLGLIVLSPLFGVQTIGVVGSIDPMGIRRSSGIHEGTSLFRVDVGRAQTTLEKRPDIAKATVKKQWFHTIAITVVGREPFVAVAAAKDVILVADNGYVIRSIPTGSAAQFATLPRLEGLALPAVGSTLSGNGESLIRVVSTLGNLARERILSVRMLDGEVILQLRKLPRTGTIGPDSSRTLVANFGSELESTLKSRALEAVLGNATLARYRTVDLRVPDAPVLEK